MTKDIKLEDLPKSKNILEHIDFANTLTNGSGIEYGFNFCKINDKITVDRMCKGTECTIHISPTVCDKNDNSFHMHPYRKTSDLSIADLASCAYGSYNNKKPTISCVKGELDVNILCKKVNAKNFDIQDILHLQKEFKKEPTSKKHKNIYDKMEKIIKPETIIFSDTGKLFYHHNKSKD